VVALSLPLFTLLQVNVMLNFFHAQWTPAIKKNSQDLHWYERVRALGCMVQGSSQGVGEGYCYG
jgi:hypothetical protein